MMGGCEGVHERMLAHWQATIQSSDGGGRAPIEGRREKLDVLVAQRPPLPHIGIRSGNIR